MDFNKVKVNDWVLCRVLQELEVYKNFKTV